MVVLRSQKLTTTCSSSSNSGRLHVSVPSLVGGSKRLRSTDTSDDPSLDGGSKRLRSRDVPPARPHEVSQADEKSKKDTSKRRYMSKQDDLAPRPYATEALRYYERSGRSYTLVKPGYITSVVLKTCILHHINFTAKRTDVADAPEEMFFAELTTTNGVQCFRFCMCLSSRHSFSGSKSNGCFYCCKYNNVQHPICGGFVSGGIMINGGRIIPEEDE